MQNDLLLTGNHCGDTESYRKRFEFTCFFRLGYISVASSGYANELKFVSMFVCVLQVVSWAQEHLGKWWKALLTDSVVLNL